MAESTVQTEAVNAGTDKTKISRWLSEVELYERESKNWRERGKKIVKRYKDERDDTKRTASQFNVLWSNTQTLLPALYARNPKPDIQRRFKDEDPIGRVASDVLERSSAYFCDTDHFASTIRQSVLDYLLPGRGTVWVRYVPHMKPAEVQVTDDVEPGDQDKPQPEVIDYEEVLTDYVHCDDFGHNICRTWEEVWLVWRKVYMDRAELVQRFKDKGKTVPLDYTQKNLKDVKLDDGVSKATIYEAWDKKRKCAVWFHKSVPEPLDERPDPLKLKDFFPCPRPLLTNLANDSLIPTPDYVEYQDQAVELDNLTGRISSITKSLKVAGVYDSSAQGIARLLAEGTENELIPVEQWALFAQKGGLDGAISLLPLKDIAGALQALYEAREKVKQDLYEITGIADIIRGQTDPNETMGAQQIKSNFATMRISDRQSEVQRFVREIIRIMVDVICGHFQIETIKQISGVRLATKQEKQLGQKMIQQAQAAGQPPQLPAGITQDQAEQMMADPSWEEVEGLIRNQPLRCFRIDIETDSTIKSDEEAEKQSRVEFLKAAGGFLQQAVEAGGQQPALIPLLGRMLMFGVRAFPVGKELESSFSSTMQKLEKEAANPQPKQDPEMAKVQAQTQLQQQQQQHDQQMAQQQAQTDAQLQQAKIQADMQLEQAKAQSQAAVQQHLNQLENERRMAELAGEQQLQREKMAMERELELEKAHIQAAASIEVARINAKADDGAEAESREASGE